MYAASAGMSILPPRHRPPMPAGRGQSSITRPVYCLESGNSPHESLHRCTLLGRRDLHRPGTGDAPLIRRQESHSCARPQLASVDVISASFGSQKTVVLCKTLGTLEIVQGSCEGELAAATRGTTGFAYFASRARSRFVVIVSLCRSPKITSCHPSLSFQLNSTLSLSFGPTLLP